MMKHLTLIITLTLGIATASIAMENDHDQLIQNDNLYKRSTAHCPKSAEFRAILREHKADVIAKRPFDFLFQGKTWLAQNIQGYNPDNMTVDEILDTLPLSYNANAQPTWAVAQLSKGGTNALALHISIKE
jgi:hypothetical protein